MSWKKVLLYLVQDSFTNFAQLKRKLLERYWNAGKEHEVFNRKEFGNLVKHRNFTIS